MKKDKEGIKDWIRAFFVSRIIHTQKSLLDYLKKYNIPLSRPTLKKYLKELIDDKEITKEVGNYYRIRDRQETYKYLLKKVL